MLSLSLFGLPIQLKSAANSVLRFFQFKLLTREQTFKFLNPYKAITHPKNSIDLPEIKDLCDTEKIYFRNKTVESETCSVWVYDRGQKQAAILPYGSILTNGKILCVDYNNHGALKGLSHFSKRRPINSQSLISPWSHVIDGFKFGGYYDFVLFVAAKLCRIKEAIPTQLFNESVISYPLFNTTYEREFLELIGILPNRLYDSRHYKVNFNSCILGDVGDWFYPNVADIKALRKVIEPKNLGQFKCHKRVYISRGGRRKITNEIQLIELLAEYEFEVIEDKFRSIPEQYAIYSNASFIIGPHGASFSNIIWCNPGTHLFEIFSPNYVPDFFLYLASLLDMKYSAYCFGALGSGDWAAGLSEDIYVSIPELRAQLEAIFNVKNF